MKDLEFELKRNQWNNTTTIGDLYLKENPSDILCNILEDKDRGLTDDMTLEQILAIKVKGETCIPYGRYEITRTKSERFSAHASKRASERTGHEVIIIVILPLLLNVKGFSGIRWHTGNKPQDTEGCQLPGRAVDFVIAGGTSTPAFHKLDDMIEAAIIKGQKIFINIIK